MREFELIFVVDQLTPEQEDAVYDNWDALIASHGRDTRLVLTGSGTSVLDGAHRAAAQLLALGIHPRRLAEDLVSRSEIAQRADVSRQAVGLWVRGERQQEAPFPAPYAPTAGGVWLWGDVARWLDRTGKSFEGAEFSYPSADDHARVNAMLADLRDRRSYRIDLSRHAEVIDAQAMAGAKGSTGWSRTAVAPRLDVTLAA